MARSFVNKLNLAEVSLGINRFLIAPEDTAWTPARVDFNSLPSGFVDLGAVQEDTPTVSMTRTKYSLNTGIPAVRQYEAVVGLEGTLEFTLHSYSWRKMQYLLGNVTPVHSTTEVSTVASVTSGRIITFANTTDVESISTVGRRITIASTSGDFGRADADETRVASITDDGLTFYLSTNLETIQDDSVVGFYDYVEQAVGTSCIKGYTALGVADLIDGTQIIHQFFKMQPGEEITLSIQPGDNVRTPLSFDVFGVEKSVLGLTGNEFVLMKTFEFPQTDDTGLCL